MTEARNIAGDWQPIESAPIDTEVLLYVDPGGVVRAGRSERGWYTSGLHCGSILFDTDRPLAWMPLPAPPRKASVNPLTLRVTMTFHKVWAQNTESGALLGDEREPSMAEDPYLLIPVNEDGSLTIGDFECRYDASTRTVWIDGPQQGDVLTMAVCVIAALLKEAAP